MPHTHIGNIKRKTDQPIKDMINLNLWREKKKNANPTTPYNFMNNPITISKVAQISFSFSINVNDNIIIAAIPILNWDMNNAVNSSWAQNQYININFFFSSGKVRVATYNENDKNNSQLSKPNHTGVNANGATNKRTIMIVVEILSRIFCIQRQTWKSVPKCLPENHKIIVWMMKIFHHPCYHRQQHPQSENCPVITKKRLTNKYTELSDQILHNKFGNLGYRIRYKYKYIYTYFWMIR